MLRSMTGFARCDASSAIGDLTCELRAVNHRYLDVQLRVPDELRPYEGELRQQVSTSVRRGKIDCGLFLKRPQAAYASMQLNGEMIAGLRAVLSELAKRFPEIGPPTPFEFLRWPGIFEDKPLQPEQMFEAATALLDETLQALNRMRQREGQRLELMLSERCESLDAIAVDIRARRPAVIEAIRDKMRERLERLASEADPARLEAEIVLLAQKLDVDEELDRLGSHLIEVRTVLGRSEPVGRRLDFLMQELNREANTLASKSGDAETTRAAVDLKVLIEQMREQVQNVE